MASPPLTQLIALNSFNTNPNLPVAVSTSMPMLMSPFLATTPVPPLGSVRPELLGLLCAPALPQQQHGLADVPGLQGQMGRSPSGSTSSPKSGAVTDAAAALLLSRLSGPPMAYVSPLKQVATVHPDMTSLAGYLGTRSYAASATTPPPPLTPPPPELQGLLGSMMPGTFSPTGSQLVELPVRGAKRSFSEETVGESVQGSTKRMAIANILSSRGGWGVALPHEGGRAAGGGGFHGPSSEVSSRSSSMGSNPATSTAQAPSRASSGLETEEGGSSKGGAAFLRFLRSMENRGVVVRRLQGEGHNEEVVGWTVVEGRMEDWRRLRKEWFMEGKQGKPYKPNSMYQVMRRLGFFPTLQTRRTSHGYDFDYSDTYVLDNSKRYVQSYARGGSHSPRTPSSPP